MSSNGDSLRSFSLSLGAFAEAIPERVQQLHQAVALEVLSGVVLMTPVDEGRARGGWTVSVGAPNPAEPGGRDPSGSATISRGAGEVRNIAPYSASYVSNAVPYIKYLNDGSSKQAPAGMVEVTLARVEAQFGAP